jgi:hypothetical protein
MAGSYHRGTLDATGPPMYHGSMGPVCHFCGASVENTRDVYRSTTCPECRRDLHICLNCRFYSPGAHYDCAETVDEIVTDKERANFCTFFAFRSSGGPGTGRGAAKGADARQKLDKLFGDG